MKEQFTVNVFNTKTQSKSTIKSTAETLGQLKADFDAARIDYSGMTFMEGATKVELKDDSSILPTNVPVKRNGVLTGETTNNIAIFLTAPNKKIASGAVADRKEAYAFLKAHPALAEEFKKKFGKNYTNGSTESLLEFVNQPKKAAKAGKVSAKTVETKAATKDDDNKVEKYLDELVKDGYITEDVRNGIICVMEGKEAPKFDIGYSSSDIEDMYGDGSWLK